MKRLTVLLGLPLFAAAALAAFDLAEPAAAASAPAPTLHAPTTAPAALIERKLGGSSMAHMALLGTEDGRALLSRAVSCALPRGESFTAIDRDGTPYAFTGELGLAPSWTARATTPAERDRLTVCLRAAGFGTLRT